MMCPRKVLPITLPRSSDIPPWPRQSSAATVYPEATYPSLSDQSPELPEYPWNIKTAGWGAGASLGSNSEAGLPGGGQLAESLAEECGYPGKDKSDLLRVAQYYALTMGEMPLRESVNEKLSQPEFQPGEVHNILASWPIEVVLTTNFDNLMERAFIKNDKDASRTLYSRFGDQEQIKIQPAVHAPLVYKLHGSLDDIDSMIMTEDNYIDFLISLIEGRGGDKFHPSCGNPLVVIT